MFEKLNESWMNHCNKNKLRNVLDNSYEWSSIQWKQCRYNKSFHETHFEGDFEEGEITVHFLYDREEVYVNDVNVEAELVEGLFALIKEYGKDVLRKEIESAIFHVAFEEKKKLVGQKVISVEKDDLNHRIIVKYDHGFEETQEIF